MRTRARLAMVAALAATVALLSPATAHAADDFGPALPGLPGEVTGGGAGTPALNAAVATACNAGTPLPGPQWFTLPTGDLGAVLVGGQGVLEGGRQPVVLGSGFVAVADSSTGAVLHCGAGPVTIGASAHAVAVVWFSADDWASVTACSDPGCPTFSARMYADRAAPVPDNDAMAAGRSIPSLPFTDSGNSVAATTDGPEMPWEFQYVSGIQPTPYGSVWWRWTAPADGRIQVQPSGTGWTSASAGLVDTTVSTTTAVLPVVDDTCFCYSHDFDVIAGHVYALALFRGLERSAPPLQVGGPYTLDVDWVSRGPAAVSTLRTSSSGIDDLLVEWTAPPATPHAAAVTGYHVQIVKHGSADAPTVVTLNDPSAVSHTFVGVDTSATYDITLHALSAAGDGASRTRVFSLADSVVYGNLAGPPARPGATRGTSALTLAWAPPSYAGTTDVTGYRVRVFLGTTSTVAKTVVVGDVTSVRVSGLRNGVAYTADVAAINAAGAGSASTRSRAVVPASRPGAPTIGLAVSGVRGLPISAVASWTPPRATGGTAITGYLVTVWRYNRAGTLIGSSVRLAAPTRVKVTLSLPSGWYRFSVRAVNAIGVGPSSARSNLVIAR